MNSIGREINDLTAKVSSKESANFYLQHFFPAVQHSLVGALVQQAPSHAHSLQTQLPVVQQAQAASQQAQQPAVTTVLDTQQLVLTAVCLLQQLALGVVAVAQHP